MEDAKSKLLLVPSEGNSTAEKAASELNVPIATLKITSSGGKCPCSHAVVLLCSNSLQSRLRSTRLHLHMLLTSLVLCSGSEAQKQRVPSETRIC